jgi:hypothetical protein
MVLEKRKSNTMSIHDSSNPDKNLSSPVEFDQTPPPSTQTIILQFAGLLVSYLVYYLRKSGIMVPILHCKVEMIGGIMPIECLILSLLVLELGLRDIYGVCSDGLASG